MKLGCGCGPNPPPFRRPLRGEARVEFRISLNDLFYAVRGVVGGSIEPTYAEPRKGDVRDSQADIRKAKALLGSEPVVSLEEGISRTIEWYRAARAAAKRIALSIALSIKPFWNACGSPA